MLKLDYLKPILKKSNAIIKFRIWMYAVSLVHLIIVASWLLTIDFRKAEDPNMWLYNKTRWKMITSWFNLLTFLYFPAGIYCDWRELQGQSGMKHVQFINRGRHLGFTSMLLPVTLFGDILFWRIWNNNRELIAPAGIDAIVPFWSQHCMHTYSLVWILFDLVLMPRERPKDMTLGMSLLMVFLTTYMFVFEVLAHTEDIAGNALWPKLGIVGAVKCADSCLNGEYIYPGLKQFTKVSQVIPLLAYIYIENLFYYTSQFLIVDMVWGSKQGVKQVS